MNPLINLDRVWDNPTKADQWRAKLPTCYQPTIRGRLRCPMCPG